MKSDPLESVRGSRRSYPSTKQLRKEIRDKKKKNKEEMGGETTYELHPIPFFAIEPELGKLQVGFDTQSLQVGRFESVFQAM